MRKWGTVLAPCVICCKCKLFQHTSYCLCGICGKNVSILHVNGASDFVVFKEEPFTGLHDVFGCERVISMSCEWAMMTVKNSWYCMYMLAWESWPLSFLVMERTWGATIDLWISWIWLSANLRQLGIWNTRQLGIRNTSWKWQGKITELGEPAVREESKAGYCKNYAWIDLAPSCCTVVRFRSKKEGTWLLLTQQRWTESDKWERARSSCFKQALQMEHLISVVLKSRDPSVAQQ